MFGLFKKSISLDTKPTHQCINTYYTKYPSYTKHPSPQNKKIKALIGTQNSIHQPPTLQKSQNIYIV
ncbi:hypothetical protein AZ602_06975 [Moraxella sp. RCAD0137]|nr:hypothetical protein AZ602_06975 [Moraxella sp. RCAD0137]